MLLRSVMVRALPHGIIGSRCVVCAEVHDRPQAGRGGGGSGLGKTRGPTRLRRARCPPSPGGGGSRAERAGGGERGASAEISPHPDRLPSPPPLAPPL